MLSRNRLKSTPFLVHCITRPTQPSCDAIQASHSPNYPHSSMLAVLVKSDPPYRDKCTHGQSHRLSPGYSYPPKMISRWLFHPDKSPYTIVHRLVHNAYPPALRAKDSSQPAVHKSATDTPLPAEAIDLLKSSVI